MIEYIIVAVLVVVLIFILICGIKIMTKPVKQNKKVKPTLVFFSADWCGHCQSFQPVWDKYAAQTDINTVQIKDGELHKQYEVEAYPNIRLYFSTPSPGSNDFKPFNDQRTFEALDEFVKRNV